ncbi:DUF6895 family protein, partial [Streptomyces anthocyanicus]
LPEPWTFERAAGYTLTHVVFHLTDWGLTPLGIPPQVADYLHQWLPPWLDTCLEDGQWDLSCELLAVAGSLPGPPDLTMLRDSWAKLARAQDPSGAVPEVGSGREGHPVADDFAGCYHSTLMTLFAAVLTDDRLRAHATAATAGTGTGAGAGTGTDTDTADDDSARTSKPSGKVRVFEHAVHATRAARPEQGGQGVSR